MNIDVKNALDKLLVVCHTALKGLPSQTKLENLDRLVIQDVLSFIEYISINGSEDRIDSFKETYLNPPYREITVNHYSGEVPESFLSFCRLDNSMSNQSDALLASLYIATICEIGKYYSLSKWDKGQIDVDKFKKYLTVLNNLLDKTKENSQPLVKKVEKRPLEASKDKLNAPVDGNTEVVETEETLEELLTKLNELIGLQEVKNDVKTLVNILSVNKIRKSRGFKVPTISKHLVFLGNPGTGKTTVARLISKIYKQLGVLEKGQLVEVDRSGLVAGYVGQTAIKTKEKIDEAMGGVLFIDEAYALAKGSSDFGQEAIDTLLKAMEDFRESFVVIVAGYSEPMEQFLASNPGLKSRFNKSIFFEDYSGEDLLAIFELFCSSNDLRLSRHTIESLTRHIANICRNKPENFANGREMRNLFEQAVANQANRLAQLNAISDDEINELTIEDFSVF